MRESVALICVVAALLLSGCDFYTGQTVALIPRESYEPKETNVALREDFNTVTQMVEDISVRQGFDEIVSEREPFRRVYQKNEADGILRITITYYPEHDLISIAVLDLQTRKQSETSKKMYTTLRDKLQAEFGDRIEPG